MNFPAQDLIIRAVIPVVIGVIFNEIVLQAMIEAIMRRRQAIDHPLANEQIQVIPLNHDKPYFFYFEQCSLHDLPMPTILPYHAPSYHKHYARIREKKIIFHKF